MHRIWRLAALAALVLVGSCDEKDSDFFTAVGEGNGTLGLAVHGTPAGATVTVLRNGTVIYTDVVDDGGHVLEGVEFGTYQVTITPPAGYTCGLATTVSVDVSDQAPDPDVEFTCSPVVGSFIISTTGLTTGNVLGINLDGPVVRTGQVGSTPFTFSDLPLGEYDWTYTQIPAFNCLPVGGSFSLTTAGQQATAQLTCSPSEGTIRATVTGATAEVAYAGPESGGGTVGATPVDFPGLAPGLYTVSITDPPGFTCGTNNQQVTVTAGNVSSVQFACTPSTGTVNVTVNGGPATVQYTGPTPGSVSAGATATPVTGLAPGNYTFLIPVPPANTSCTGPVMVTVTAGGTASAAFTCTPVTTLTSVLLQLPGTIPCPGAVPGGTYTNALLDANTMQPVGTSTSVSTIGSPTFCGTNPSRLGFGDGEGYRFGTSFTISGEPWNVIGFGLCATSTFSGGVNLLNVTYRDQALTSIGNDQMTTGPACFWGTVPSGTRFVDVTAQGALSLDINTIRFWR